MPTTDQPTAGAVQQPDPQPASPTPAEPGRYVTYAWMSILLAAVAWISTGLNGYLSAAVAAVAVAIGFMALRSHRHGVRNTAITAIIAAGVLLTVLIAFIIVIRRGLGAA